MSHFRRHGMFALWAILSFAPAAHGQQSSPRIGYVAPAGGQQGTSLLITVGGRYLDGTTQAFISGSGVQVKVVESFRAMRQDQTNSLKTRVQKLLEKKAASEGASPANSADKASARTAARTKWTPEEEMLLAALKKKLAISLRAPPVPATAETVMLQVTLATDAAPGQREIRLETAKGLTNPMAFWVGKLPELVKEIPINEQLLAAKENRTRNEPKAAPTEPPVEIKLPTVANGQIMPGGVDRFHFAARQGQKLVIAAGARELIPYISDAVPGWFQAALTLYDAQGHELAYADHYSFHPDPVLHFEVPRDGDYMVEIRDSLYRGREDFVYRLTIGELPFVTSIFPLGGAAGSHTAVELRGWNLPATSLAQDARDEGPGIYLLAVGSEAQIANPVLFKLDTLPECVEQEAHDRPENAQVVALPIMVNGRIDPADQTDMYRFDGHAGEEIVAEVYARRLGSPLDSVLKLTDAAGQQLAYNDDHEDKGSGLNTHHADSYLRAKLPADGAYYLQLRDVQHKGGPEYAYRLRISRPQPDFDLRIVPASITGRGGSSVPITVHAVRKDGFSGEIALALKDAPEGFTLSGGTVPANEDQVKLTLKVLPIPQQGPIDLRLEGTATIDGRQLAHLAVPSEDMMQAFEYRHLVPAQELKVAVSGRYTPPRPVVKIAGKTPVKIPAGGTARLQLSVVPRSLVGKFKIELRKPPAGIAIETISAGRDGLEIVLQADADKVKPGLRGNLQIAAVAEKPPKSDSPHPADNPARWALPPMPAIPFEIVKP